MKFKNFFKDVLFGNINPLDTEPCAIYDRYATGDISSSKLYVHSEQCHWCKLHLESVNGIVNGCNCFACNILLSEQDAIVIKIKYDAAHLVKKYFYLAQKRNSSLEEVRDYKSKIHSMTKEYMRVSGMDKNECFGEILEQALVL